MIIGDDQHLTVPTCTTISIFKHLHAAEIRMGLASIQAALAAFTIPMGVAAIAILMGSFRLHSKIDPYLLGGASGSWMPPEAGRFRRIWLQLLGALIQAPSRTHALRRGLQFVNRVEADGGRLEIVIRRTANLIDALSGTSARARAIRYFAENGLWNTEDRAGILVLVTLSDRSVEIVADRTLAGGHDTERFAALTREMTRSFQQRDFDDGLTLCASECLHIIRSELSASRNQAGQRRPMRVGVTTEAAA